MAEPHPRAGRARRRRPARVLLLAGAVLAIVLSALFIGRSASAATTAGTATKQSVATVLSAAKTATAEKAGLTGDSAAAKTTGESTGAQLTGLTSSTELDGGVCSVPGIGDIGSLLDLCNAGTSGLIGAANSICTSGAPAPELANTGIDSMITTPGATQTAGKTLYDNYGMAGLYWASTGLTCSQMTSTIGNNVAGMVFDMAKSLDRVTITTYQSAAGSNILGWLSNSVDRLITSLGNAVYFPFLAPMVIIAAIWLAWQGLIKKRATRTFEGVIWMVVAAAAAIWLIGQPSTFTGVGTTVSNGVTSVLNSAFANLPAANNSDCLPITTGDTQSVTANYSFTTGNGLVDNNANELWSVLVCKPWLDGEFGTTQYAAPGTSQKQTLVNQYGRQLLWAQAVAVNENPTTALVNAKEQTYSGIANELSTTNPAIYSLFQGDQWTTRLEVGFEALFAAVAAGLLILLIALTLIILKLGFLLLLVAGPFFLIIGIHPGFGRVVAIRWFEMLIGVLLKQVAVALTLSVLLYCYSLIMGQSDEVLPWALKIMMIALVTVAVFIYRKPFQHLFSSVGYGMLGNDERAQGSWRESALGFRRVTQSATGVAVPGTGAATAARWARRGTAADGAASDAAQGGGVAASGAAASEGMSVGPSADSHVSARQWPDAGVGTSSRSAPPPLPPRGGPPVNTGAASAGWARNGATGTTGSRSSAHPPVRQTGGTPATPPATGGTGNPPATPFWGRSRRRPQ
jgi:hypothetical protein